MRIGIIIPTYMRAKDLSRLLDSIAAQIELPEEILIAVGPGDEQGLAVANEWKTKWSAIQICTIQKPSVVYSLNTALSQIKGDIICILDDDVWLPVDWSKKIKRAYQQDKRLGAYGGRDHLQLDEHSLANPPLASLIGTFRWHLGLVGNHHRGVYNSPVRVDAIKGCNLSFRRTAFDIMQIDTKLESKGAENFWEVDICQYIQLAGFDIVYDNENYVLHYASPRMAFDTRNNLFGSTYTNMFNEGLIYAKFRPKTEIATFFLRTLFIGAWSRPGLLRLPFILHKHGLAVLKLPWQYALFAQRGIRQGLQQRRHLKPL